MTQLAYVIWPLTGSNVMQGHSGQKGYFYEKRIKSLELGSMVNSKVILITNSNAE